MLAGQPVSARTAARGIYLVVAAIGLASLALVVIAGLAGPQDGSRNPANYLTWLYFWPGVAILVAVVGDVWPYLNPWRILGLMLRGGQAAPPPVSLWQAVALFAGFAWFDLASGLSNRPRNLAIAALLFSAFVLLPVPLLGARWLAKTDAFALVLGAVGRNSVHSLLRPSARSVDDPGAGWDRFALYLLPLAAAIFDALIATSQWTSLASAAGGGAGLERGGVTFIAIRTLGLAVTCIAVVVLLLAAAAMVGSSGGLARTATRMALVTLPAAVMLMAAHNLPALLQLAPRLPAVLVAFAAGSPAATGISPETPIAVTSSSPIWALEVALLTLGFIWSAWLAWRDLEPPASRPFDRIAAAYPAWAVLTLTSSAALLILYQPVAILTAR